MGSRLEGGVQDPRSQHWPDSEGGGGGRREKKERRDTNTTVWLYTPNSTEFGDLG